MQPGKVPNLSLTRSEFAAVRAYVQGMPAAMVAGRYLSDDSDDDDAGGESALRLLLGLRDRMVQLAHLHSRQDLAELLEGGPGRSNRGMDRRVEALAELERLGTAQPRADHGIELWFSPALARRLRAQKITNLHILVDLANCHGNAWWRSVPRIGALAGAAINRWLADHRDVVRDERGEPLLRDHVFARGRLAEATLGPQLRQLVPFELMRVEESGTVAGTTPICDVKGAFDSDLTAVRAWLAANHAQQSTWLAYRKEAERLLLWTAMERGKALAMLDQQDRQDYFAFLRHPAPARLWVGPRAPRESAAWRPFTGPLSESSVLHASRILGALFEWLQNQGHVAEHVWQPESQAKRMASRVAVPVAAGTTLEPESLAGFLDWLAAQGRDPEGIRYRAAEAAVRLLQEQPIGFASLATLTRDKLGTHEEVGTREEVGTLGAAKARCGEEGLSAAARGALANHWQDRGLDWDSLARQPIVLVGPPRLPPTGRARRKADRSPGSGYSVRGLHALLSQAIDRYREAEDAEFAARSPRDLAGRRTRVKSAGTVGKAPEDSGADVEGHVDPALG
ncbi:integrase/recombinase [Cupriavidus basilensis OR16]|uniref:Integrase/recombinase n=1 Tax=Cupriavidus basilensis OR16 TaxID=1127483 RepID=H1S6K8_9BURK|nr:phage integrase family protein [Cupriavidus basilensis]EHP41669.1 integrase/recombinase [Cupriavidus basilensis OR16]